MSDARDEPVPLRPEEPTSHGRDELGVDDFGVDSLDRRDPGGVVPEPRDAPTETGVAKDEWDDEGELELAPDPNPPKPKKRRPPPIEVAMADLEPVEEVTTQRTVGVMPEDVVADERPCRQCGYILLGLPKTGNCPECGTPIRLSGATRRLYHANAGWLKQVAYGYRLMFWTLIASIAYSLTITWFMPNVVDMFFGGVTSTALAVGAFLATQPDPMGTHGLAGERLRLSIRILTGFGIAAAAGSVVWEFVPNLIILGGAILLWLGWLLVYPLLSAYTRALAARALDDDTADWAHTCQWGFTAVYGVAISLGVLVFLGELVGGNISGVAIVGSSCIGLLMLLVFLGFLIAFIILLKKAADMVERDASPDAAKVRLNEERDARLRKLYIDRKPVTQRVAR